VLPPDDVDRAMAVLTAKHVPSWVLGEVRATRDDEGPADTGHAVLRGDHPRF
jgi:phosphoribosylformylglycinamidine cyclo-ligase